MILTPPVAVRGKKRLAFVSLEDINVGEELMWNPSLYNNWLTGTLTGFVVFNFSAFTFS